MRPRLGYLHYVNARVLHYVSAPRTGRWITLMSRGRLGPPGHKSDLYTNMSALVAAKSPGFKSEIRLASIVGWSGGHDPIRGRKRRHGENFYNSAVARARCGHTEIFSTIHLRRLHYVAFTYRSFEWLFYRVITRMEHCRMEVISFLRPRISKSEPKDSTAGLRMHFRDVLRAIPRNSSSPSVRWMETNLHISKDTRWLWNSDEIEWTRISLPPHFRISNLKHIFRYSFSPFFYFYLLDLYVKFLHDYIHFAKFWKILGWSQLEMYYLR